eukprot:TRINITY_DN78317_c0_g1_i1.p1 TRINITY_DN78317_c0_g1~~TRINITY_DN78317_c0_g1_i1.p1  ORF type:complete len:837 (-),score=222.85 TRINITY_DN78317_c0_g1_i1:124-2634(-)
MSAEPDYYELIGVQRGATLHEIRAEFRKKVLAEHPDKGGDPKKFQLLNKAYNVLTDQDKRRRYDATGRTDRTAEEEFAESFGGGRHSREERPKQADEKAVVNLEQRMSKGAGGEHEDGFQEWLRQRDQQEMVMTDKDFMKTALFNAAEMSTQVKHPSPVQHVLGSPKTDAYGQTLGGAVQVQSKPRPLKKTIDHDELLVRMLSVPVDDAMVYAELNKSGVCLGMTGVGKVEQLGTRIESLKQDDTVLVLPKPTKFSSQRPIGTARTLLHCNEEDLIRIPVEVLEELTPEQICLAPSIVCAYTLLEVFGAKLKPGDSVLMNAAHLSACGSSLLQLCRLLKLKPLCLLTLPGAPKNLVKGEYGSKSAWQDADTRAQVPKNVQTQYERISEWLITMGAEEVFPDAVALLRWRDRNQRMLPKLALDGIATRDSTEQLIHCLQAGDKDSQLVVYGHGVAQPIEVTPPLLSAWGGGLIGFNIARWVHSLSANAKKMMAVMENITKLVRANKFTLDTVLYKVGEDAISDAFSRAADASDSSQVVLIFPTLQEELRNNPEQMEQETTQRGNAQAGQATKKKEEDEREKLKTDWLNLLFTDQSVAAMNPEGPLPVSLQMGDDRPESLVVWVGDNPKGEAMALKDVRNSLGRAALVAPSWSQHPAGEGMLEFEVMTQEVMDGSWYLRNRQSFENEDLDMLHDVELLGRSLVEAVEPLLKQHGLQWKNVVLAGFGKGAGIALYAALLKIIPQQVSAMILFSPIVTFPSFLAEKLSAMKRDTNPVKMFTVWGNRNKATPGSYRQLLAQALRKAPEVHNTPDTLPDGDHTFDVKSYGVLTSLLPLCLPR